MSRKKTLKATAATTNVVALVMALFGAIEVASANHELAVTFQHLDGYEGVWLPIGGA